MPTVATEIRLHALVPAAPPQALPRTEAVAGPVVRVRVWDLPTRVFHWALVASLVGLAATGYAGGAWIDWHARLGSLVLALLLFRVVWGVVGGRWSRFRSFLPTPAKVLRYLRGESTPEQEAGHSPLGALSLLAMLLMLLAQVATGLVSDDGGGFTGPLNAWVSSGVGETATLLHKAYGQWMLLGLVLLHIAAIAFYRIARKRKLVQAMLDGDKLLPRGRVVPPARDDAGTRTLGAVILCACLLAVGMLTGF
jgi:cytochrome b